VLMSPYELPVHFRRFGRVVGEYSFVSVLSLATVVPYAVGSSLFVFVNYGVVTRDATHLTSGVIDATVLCIGGLMCVTVGA
jgi:hypothetical protein